MARARTIKPGFFANDQLAELRPLVRLLFAGLWCLADRAGRLLDRPKKIKADVMAYDTLNVESALKELEAAGFVVRYEVDGQRCIQVLNWLKHQHPHPQELPSELPPPPGSEDLSNGHETGSIPDSAPLSSHSKNGSIPEADRLNTGVNRAGTSSSSSSSSSGTLTPSGGTSPQPPPQAAGERHRRRERERSLSTTDSTTPSSGCPGCGKLNWDTRMGPLCPQCERLKTHPEQQRRPARKRPPSLTAEAASA